MIPAILLGRKGSVGFPGKNTTKVLGRRMAEYPILACRASKSVSAVYLSSDCPNLEQLAHDLDVPFIKRPPHLCTNEALAEDAYVHAYEYIKAQNPNETIEAVVMLFCNAPTFLASHLDEGVAALRKDATLDSAVTVSQYNWYAPVRARKIGADGLVHPFIPFEAYPKEMKIDCDRNTQGDCYFADVNVVVARPRCLDNVKQGILPQRWMGQRIHPIMNWGGLDVDKEWQMGQVEFWLKAHGFDTNKTPYIT